MTTLNKAQAAIKLFADGFQNKDSFNAEFMKLFPEFPRSTAGYFSDAFRYHNPGLSQTRGGIAKVKEPKAPKEPKVAKEPKQPKVSPKPTKAQRQAELKSPDEIAEIKAANLVRMQQVTAKVKKYSQVARAEGDGVDGFDPNTAKAEVAYYNETGEYPDSWKSPAFLTADEVKALV